MTTPTPQHPTSAPTAYTGNFGYPSPQGQPAPKNRSILRSLWLPWTLVAVLTLTLAGLLIAPYIPAGNAGGTAAAAPKVWAKQHLLKVARDKCDTTAAGTRLADGDKTLVVNTAGEEDGSGLNVSQAACILEELKAPASVLEQMDSTRALDGRQQATWGDFTASWTYHPDDGLDLILTEK